MKLRELKERVNEIEDRFLDNDILVDIETKNFALNIKDIDNIWLDTKQKQIVILTILENE